jgi:hypothetical protein
MQLSCERCGETVSLLFPSLGRKVCFGCLSTVMRLTSGYAALRDLAASDMGQAMVELDRRERRAPGSTRCIRCFSAGAAIYGPPGRLCVACSLALVAG